MLQNLQKALQANPDAHSFDEVLLFSLLQFHIFLSIWFFIIRIQDGF